MRVLSLCASAGLWDRAWIEAGHEVVAGCELMGHKRAIYAEFCGGEPLCHDIHDLPDIVRGEHFDGVFGGIPCQSFSKLKAMRAPKFPDLTAAALEVLDAVKFEWFVFENVAKLNIAGATHTRLDAMHYARPHQSRPRWFTHSRNIAPLGPTFSGGVDDLMAYPIVAGRLYGPKRGAVLQGWPEFAKLKFPCVALQEAPADGVARGVADAWIHGISNGWDLV